MADLLSPQNLFLAGLVVVILFLIWSRIQASSDAKATAQKNEAMARRRAAAARARETAPVSAMSRRTAPPRPPMPQHAPHNGGPAGMNAVVPPAPPRVPTPTTSPTMDAIQKAVAQAGSFVPVNLTTEETQSALGKLDTVTETELKEGIGYLAKDIPLDKCMAIVRREVRGRGGGIVVSRQHPDQLKEMVQADNVRFIWLTSVAADDTVAPEDLEILHHDLKEFYKDHPGKLIFMEGVEYLNNHNSFESVLKLLNSLKDLAALHKSVLMITAAPAAMEQIQFSQMEREFTVLGA